MASELYNSISNLLPCKRAQGLKPNARLNKGLKKLSLPAKKRRAKENRPGMERSVCECNLMRVPWSADRGERTWASRAPAGPEADQKPAGALLTIPQPTTVRIIIRTKFCRGRASFVAVTTSRSPSKFHSALNITLLFNFVNARHKYLCYTGRHI